ncbi:MAG: right-handed parallel beta-helix repeat-containing protein [Candidatus Latescibacteria bacterium]|nr:right-handed parallel beta-helix repeat-containing protein [Candidatus Latescibacterota bacterium]
MDYYVSLDGNDENSGKVEEPFLTIQRAADAMVAGDTCVVGGGVYRETVSVRNGGREGMPVRFVAAPGEEVVLKGTEVICGDWSVHEGAIYKTQVDEVFEQVFVDDEMMIEARWPNARFDQLLGRECWAKTNVGSRYGKIVDSDLAKTEIDWTGAIATLNVAHQFFSWTRKVVKHNAGSDTFEYGKDLPGITHFADKTTPWESNVYYLSGKLEALDMPTEWYLDTEEKALYLWTPDGDDPGNCEVEVKVRDYGFDVEGGDYVEIQGFQLFGCTVRFQDCNYCAIDGCHLRFSTYARQLTDSEAEPSPMASTILQGNHNTIQNSSLAHSSTSGITMQGSNNKMENCLVHDFCWNGSLRYVGIRMTPMGPSDADESEDPGRSVVRKCSVFDAGNACVSINGMPDNVVEYCHIYDGGKACKDVSLLYTHLPNIAGTVFRYNWVHDCHTPHIALGIRGDDQTRGLIVHHNVVWNCGWEGIVVKGDNNRIYHNTCFNNGMMDIRVDSTSEPKKAWRKQWPLLEEQNAHTETFNNCAADIRGWRDDGVPPGGEAANNFSCELVNSEQLDFRPKDGSRLIDAGCVISGINDGYLGQAPDVGAYEYGKESWAAGCNKELWDAVQDLESDQ